MQNRTIIQTPVSTFSEFCAEDDENKQLNLVRRVKNRSGKGGASTPVRFRQFVTSACYPGQDIDAVADELNTRIASNSRDKERLRTLADTFIGQCRKHTYRFFNVQGNSVFLDRLKIKMYPDLGVATRAGDEIAFRLWLSNRDVLDKERDAFIFLMSEAKRAAQWPLHWRFGVWELEQERIRHEITVSDALRNLIYDKAEMFAKMWDELPNKQSPPLSSVPVGQGHLLET